MAYNIEEDVSYNPLFLDKDIINKSIRPDKYAEFVRQDQLKLIECSDDCGWTPGPNSLIWQYINRSSFDSIQITMLDEILDLSKLKSRLIQSKDVGLVLLGPDISRHSNPHVIVLVTHRVYYVIRGSDEKRGIPFLRNLICDQNGITFWTIDGIEGSMCLYHRYQIDLYQMNAKDCIGVHLHLMQLLSFIPANQEMTSDLYPKRAFRAARNRDLPLRKFEQLIRLWLEIDEDELDFRQSQLAHLSNMPLDITAMNIIKKRCLLVLKLAEVLEHYCWTEFYQMNHNSLIARIGNDKDSAYIMRRGLIDHKEKKEAPLHSFIHLVQGEFSGL